MRWGIRAGLAVGSRLDGGENVDVVDALELGERGGGAAVEKTLLTVNGLNMKNEFLREMRARAVPCVETHHVAWGMLTPDIMKWWKE